MPLIGLFLVFCAFLPLVGGLSSYYELQALQLAVFLVLGLIAFAVVVRIESATLKDHTFLVLVWSVSLSLVLSSASFSQYLWGWDIQREFPIFQQVSRTGFWNVGNDFFYNSSIAISILPAMVRAVSGLGSQEVFKFVYPLIYSAVPVVLYKIYRRMLSPGSAFLSAYLFMSYWPFYTEILQIGKTQIAELLLVVLSFVFLSGIGRKRRGVMVALLLSVALIVSHYTLSYIYILFLAFSFFVSRIARRVVAVSSLTMVVVCGVLTFAWYSFVSRGSAVLELTRFLSIVYEGMVRDFFDPGKRPLVAMQAAGLAAVTPGFLHDLYRLTNYVVQFCIIVGFIVLARKRNKNVAERKMLPLVTISLVFVGSAVILPLFGGIPFYRIYHYALLFASPCFVIGAEMLELWWRRAYSSASYKLRFPQFPFSSRGRKIVAATVLLSYFLFTSGWVWAVSLDRPTSIILDSRRLANDPGNTIAAYYADTDLPADVNAAVWLRWHRQEFGFHLCADVASLHALTAYGELELKFLRYCNLQKSYVFLSELVMLHGIEIDLAGEFASAVLLPISPGLFAQDSNRLYSNGGAAIYEGLG